MTDTKIEALASKKNSVSGILGEKVYSAFKNSGLKLDDWEPQIIPCKLDNIDFTINNIGTLFKKNGKEAVMNKLDFVCTELASMADEMYTVSIAKLYINFLINKKFLHKFIFTGLTSEIISKAPVRLKIIVDFSSPNVAKEMHVGHLRSTIIGDVIANLAAIRGHEVLRINHIGDFGQNFGMIIEWIIRNGLTEKVLSNQLELSLQDIYKKAKDQYKNEDGKDLKPFQEGSSANTVKLQNYDKPDHDIVVKLWYEICSMSRKNYQQIYDRLSIRITECGESFYQKYIPTVISELNEKKLTKFDGNDEKKRLVIESPYTIEKKKIDEKGNEINETSRDVLTLVKHNLGYTYDTTDVTCLWYRLNVLGADKIYYVVDAGQGTHFIQLFNVADKAKWLTRGQTVAHIDFGVVSGDDGKRLRSRDGDSIKLIDLLDKSLIETKRIMILNFHEREKREKEKKKINVGVAKESLSSSSSDIVEKTEPTFDEETIKSLAYGSIKYADLCVNRKANYTFSYERMLNFKGNTMIFIMYARIRALAILNKIPKEITKKSIIEYISYFISETINPEFNKGDYDILFKMITLEDVISKAEKGYPDHICTYLYELADLLNYSYSQNRCIIYDEDGIKIISINISRVALYLVLVKIMDICLGLLNIDLIDKL